MKEPVHPGEVVRELCIDPLGLSVTKAAEILGVTRKTLSELVNGHTGISPEMAVRARPLNRPPFPDFSFSVIHFGLFLLIPVLSNRLY